MQCWCHLALHGSKEPCPCCYSHAHHEYNIIAMKPEELFVFLLYYIYLLYPILSIFIRKKNLMNNNWDRKGEPNHCYGLRAGLKLRIHLVL